MLTETELAEIEARTAALNHEQWEIVQEKFHNFTDTLYESDWKGNLLASLNQNGAYPEISQFIVHSRSDVPRLCAEVRRLLTENERLKADNEARRQKTYTKVEREAMGIVQRAAARLESLEKENERLRRLAVGTYLKECPTEPDWYFARHPRPDDNAELPCEIWRGSDGTLWVESFEGAEIHNLTVQAAFAEGYRFARIPTPEGK